MASFKVSVKYVTTIVNGIILSLNKEAPDYGQTLATWKDQQCCSWTLAAGAINFNSNLKLFVRPFDDDGDTGCVYYGLTSPSAKQKLTPLIYSRYDNGSGCWVVTTFLSKCQ